jgi:hypothetical protein
MVNADTRGRAIQAIQALCCLSCNCWSYGSPMILTPKNYKKKI